MRWAADARPPHDGDPEDDGGDRHHRRYGRRLCRDRRPPRPRSAVAGRSEAAEFLKTSTGSIATPRRSPRLKTFSAASRAARPNRPGTSSRRERLDRAGPGREPIALDLPRNSIFLHMPATPSAPQAGDLRFASHRNTPSRKQRRASAATEISSVRKASTVGRNTPTCFSVRERRYDVRL